VGACNKLNLPRKRLAILEKDGGTILEMDIDIVQSTKLSSAHIHFNGSINHS
jgi:hypothetical protein